MSDYEEKANKFLEAHGISFKAIYISDDCPDWCDDSHIHGDKYEASFSREGREDLKLFFWNSYHDKMKGISPVAYDVLAAITKTDPGSFEDFCDELGYDSDSRKAEATYKAVKAEWEKVNLFFALDEIEALEEIV